MAWVKLDDQFFRHRKARAAGKDGRALFLASCCYSAAGLTDGFIKRSDLSLLCAEAEVRQATAQTLVEVGLWDAVEDGWMVHDFLDRNPSAEEVTEQRRQAAERQRRRRRKDDGTYARESQRESRRDNQRESRPPRPVPEGKTGRMSEEPARDGRPSPAAPSLASRISDLRRQAARLDDHDLRDALLHDARQLEAQMAGGAA